MAVKKKTQYVLIVGDGSSLEDCHWEELSFYGPYTGIRPATRKVKELFDGFPDGIRRAQQDRIFSIEPLST